MISTQPTSLDSGMYKGSNENINKAIQGSWRKQRKEQIYEHSNGEEATHKEGDSNRREVERLKETINVD